MHDDIDVAVRRMADLDLDPLDLAALQQRIGERLRSELTACAASASTVRGTRPRRRVASRARFATALVAVVAIAGATYAVPVTRAAVDDAYSALSDWISGGEGAAPGRAVAGGEDLPPWVAAEDGEKRVLADAGGEKLVAIRQGDKLTLALAGFGTTGTIDDLRQSLAGQPIMIVGPGRFIPDGLHDRRPLFGLVSSSVKRIQFNYADGSPPVSADDLTGAFGIVIETNRHPSSLTGYGEAGSFISRLDLRAQDFRYCPWRGCMPWIK